MAAAVHIAPQGGQILRPDAIARAGGNRPGRLPHPHGGSCPHASAQTPSKISNVPVRDE